MAALRLQTYETPSYFNKDTLLGGLIGSYLGTPFIGGPIGAAIGGYLGKERMKREQAYGKEINEPTIFNKGMAIGALGAPPLAAIAGGLLTVSIMILTNCDMGSLTQMSILGTKFAALGAVVAGGIYGGSYSKSDMEKEYAMAELQQRQRQSEHQKGQGQQTAGEQEHSQERGNKFTKMIDAQRGQTYRPQIG